MRRRPLWIALVAAGTAALLGVGVTSFVLFLQAKAAARPEAIVSTYLDHVRDGDIEAAMRMEDRTPDKAQVLLTNAAYARATERLTGYRIVGVRPLGSGRTLVDIETKAGGETARASLALKSAGWTPGELLGVVAWQLQPASLSTIDVAVGAPGSVSATLAGARIDIGAHPALLAFPGRYALHAAADSPWFTLPDASAAVTGFQQRADLAADAALTAKGQEAATAAANAWVSACMQGGPQPSGCSFGLTEGETPGQVWTNQKWTLATPPQLKVAGWRADCGLPGQQAGTGCWPVQTTTPGSVDFSADYTVPATGESGTITSTDSIQVEVEGGITAIGGGGAQFSSVQWH